VARDIFIIAGGFKLPDGNASAQRALANAHLFKSLGYTVVMVGKHHRGPDSGDSAPVTHFQVEGFDCYNIEGPDTERKYSSYVLTNDVIERVVDKCGKDRVFAIMAYNYPNDGLRLMEKFARQNGIIPIADTTEWYGFEKWTPGGIQRFLRHEYRMRVVQKRVKNLICGSRYLRDYYKGLNTVIVPNCVDMSAPKWSTPLPPREPGPRRFVYAGSPGHGMKKEYIHWVVDAFARCKEAGHKFVFTVVGITEKQLLDMFPEYESKVKALGDQIVFRGRIPHVKALEEIRQSDFFVFLRPNTRVNRAGCPTKLAEAFGCGIPTISNASGDVGVYLSSPSYGFLFPEPDRDQLTDGVTKALSVDEATLQEMKAACFRDNPFRYELYQDKVREFLARAQ
jgi:glycosyltransferase involved in cell wall biosynthesis